MHSCRVCVSYSLKAIWNEHVVFLFHSFFGSHRKKDKVQMKYASSSIIRMKGENVVNVVGKIQDLFI